MRFAIQVRLWDSVRDVVVRTSNSEMTRRRAHKKNLVPFLALLTASLGIGMTASPANSQNATCRDLQTRLASLERSSSGGNPNYQKWSRSVDDQRRALKQTERQARAGNCRINGRISFGAPHPQCDQIERTLNRMSANLTKLERRRDRYAGNNGGSAKAKQAIRRQMRQYQCGTQPGRRANRGSNLAPGLSSTWENDNRTGRVQNDFGRSRPRSEVLINPGRRQRQTDPEPEYRGRRSGGGFFARLFGLPPRTPDRYRDRYRDPYRDRENSSVRFRSRRVLPHSPRYGRDRPEDEDFFDDYSYGSFSGTYRTMCVRQCDGYYFPISFSTTEESFGRDAEICSRLCPSGDAELFVHENPGSTPENMTSLYGVAYTDLPNAFQYRRSLNKSCSCRSAYGKVTTLSRLYVRDGVVQVRKNPPDPVNSNLPVPVAKRPVDLDPDSRMNLVGKYRPAGIKPKVAKNRAKKQTVRIVGPKYFYSQ